MNDNIGAAMAHVLGLVTKCSGDYICGECGGMSPSDHTRECRVGYFEAFVNDRNASVKVSQK